MWMKRGIRVVQVRVLQNFRIIQYVTPVPLLPKSSYYYNGFCWCWL